MNKLKKIMGYTECCDCKKEFKKNKNTAIGMTGNKTVYWCQECSSNILNRAMSGENPFTQKEKKHEKQKEKTSM